MTGTNRKRKLIEVALPLEDISRAARADKAVKTGTIRNLHKWFAPMPLPAWRAILFAALVDDPEDDDHRVYLLGLIKRLVENGASLPAPDTLAEATAILTEQFPTGLPTVFDPFCGGGSTLVEAQRLGLSTHGSDLNPVPLLITRTLTETLPAVHGGRAITDGGLAQDPDFSALFDAGDAPDRGYRGLVQDTLQYAAAVKACAAEVLQGCYAITAGEVPIAWVWARTGSCQNPACAIETVLSTSWWLSKRQGDLAWVSPRIVDGEVALEVVTGQRDGEAPPAPKVGRGASFACLGCASVMTEAQVLQQGKAGGLGLRLVAVIAERDGGRVTRAPWPAEEQAAVSVLPPNDFPHIELPDIPRWFSGPRFGFATQESQYTNRQRFVLCTFADAVAGVHAQVIADGGTKKWADAITTLLGLAVGKMAQYGSTQTFLFTRNGPSAAKAAFGRADLPMMWDFVETYPFGTSIGSWDTLVANMLRALPFVPAGTGTTSRGDARTATSTGEFSVVATDPPYFDAIGYADLSDFFYVWHRRALRAVHPDLYGTIAAPKFGELTAIPRTTVTARAQHANTSSRASRRLSEA